MINAINIDSVARCKYVQSFVAKVAAEQHYVDPITGETIQAPDDSPLNRLLIHSNFSRGLVFDWFVLHHFVRRHDEVHVLDASRR